MNRNKVKERIAELFYGGYCELEDREEYEWQEALSLADQILADPDILIKAENQELPKDNYMNNPSPHSSLEASRDSALFYGYRRSQRDMLKDNWMKVEEK